MLADFYGKVIVGPTVVEHRRSDFELAICQLNQFVKRHGVKDLIVCIEMTGTYHKPVWRAFREAGFETRLVHPFASSHFRLPENGDIKTDDNDLAAIFRAAVNGFGLVEKPVDTTYRELQILCRHRRDLVNKRSKLQCQIRHHLQHCLPGFGSLFEGDTLWSQATPVPLLKAIAEHGGTARSIVEAGQAGVAKWLQEAKVRFHQKTLDRVFVWAANATSHDEMAAIYTRVWCSLLDDWQAKQQQIAELERNMASVFVRTPYVLLMSHPGINVVSGAELAGELGPIENYASPKAVSGRSGLFPSRYQSDQVDRGGKLSRFRNGRLRAAWLRVADNMIKCNAYWRVKAAAWKAQGYDARDIRCRIANRLTRIVFQMIFGRKLFQHPSRLDRGYVMEKLLVYHREHQTPPDVIVRDLERAAEQIPKASHAEEAKPLVSIYQKARRSRRREPQAVGTLLVAVLARLGVEDPDEQELELT
ncbi:MAG: IS110 family transposase [Gammaproteobacteria bacterium]|nr:IS110 family transposase [Gammaproteobacteria bacterium]